MGSAVFVAIISADILNAIILASDLLIASILTPVIAAVLFFVAIKIMRKINPSW